MDSNIGPKTRAIVNIDMLFYLNNAYMLHNTFLCTVSLIEVCILFTTKPCSTHTKMRLVIVLFGLCLICKYHCDWRSNRWLYYDRRVKILDRSLSRCLENDSKLFIYGSMWSEKNVSNGGRGGRGERTLLQKASLIYICSRTIWTNLLTGASYVKRMLCVGR